MALQNLFDHVAHVAVAHVGLAERVVVDLCQLTDRGPDHRITEIEPALVAVGKRPRREVNGREWQGGIVERGEVLTEQPRLLQLAAGGANRFRRLRPCLHGHLAYGEVDGEADAEANGSIWSAGGAVIVTPVLYLSKLSVMFCPPVWVSTYFTG